MTTFFDQSGPSAASMPCRSPEASPSAKAQVSLVFTAIFAGVVLARMRAILADVQAEARLRRKAEAA